MSCPRQRIGIAVHARVLGPTLSIGLATFVLTGHSGPVAPSIPTTTLRAVQARAEKFNVIVDLPACEPTSDQLQATVTSTIAAAGAALNRIGSLDEAVITFGNTVAALDDQVPIFRSAVSARRV